MMWLCFVVCNKIFYVWQCEVRRLNEHKAPVSFYIWPLTLCFVHLRHKVPPNGQKYDYHYIQGVFSLHKSCQI